jgi:hypothetical protein
MMDENTSQYICLGLAIAACYGPEIYTQITRVPLIIDKVSDKIRGDFRTRIEHIDDMTTE